MTNSRSIDAQDVLLLVGVISLVGGVAAWSRPAAAVLFGVLCLASVLLIELTRKGRES